MNAPKTGWTTQAKISRVKDGDTVEVTIERKFTIRLSHPNDNGLMFNTPSISTPEGVMARDALENLFPVGKTVTVFIPANNPYELMDFETLKRMIGEIWIDNLRVTDIMLEKGFAKLVKRKDINESPTQGKKTSPEV